MEAVRGQKAKTFSEGHKKHEGVDFLKKGFNKSCIPRTGSRESIGVKRISVQSDIVEERRQGTSVQS